jgi:hypothetical protein
VAQPVYSLNIVGYVNQAVPAGTIAAPSFVLVGNPLKAAPDNTVATVFGTQVPDTASLLTWNGAGFDEDISYGGGVWDTTTLDVAPGKGFFVKNTGASFNITFVGEVLAGLQTNAMTGYFNLVSSKVPVAGNLNTSVNLNLTNAVANDSLLTWNGAGYDENIYYGGGVWDTDPNVTVAQGFFYKQNPTTPTHTVNWVTVGFP